MPDLISPGSDRDLAPISAQVKLKMINFGFVSPLAPGTSTDHTRPWKGTAACEEDGYMTGIKNLLRVMRSTTELIEKNPARCGSASKATRKHAEGALSVGFGSSPMPQSQTSTAKNTNPSAAAAASDNPYFGVETLLKSVESGAIAPIKGTWLIGLHKRGGRLARRQDLPPEAFWTADELRRVALALGDDFGLLFVSLSYKWLTKVRKGRDPDHPDPNGYHLGIVASVVELYLGLTGIGSNLADAFEERELGPPELAMFWDFSSLHQEPRTDAETTLFGQGMDLSTVWYGHSRTVVWMQTEVPEGFEGIPYATSGWCFMEAQVSAAVKPGFLRLDLARRTKKAMDYKYGPSDSDPEACLANVCAQHRPPPPTPERVRHLLQTVQRFTNPADWEKVSELYGAFFESITQVIALNFRGLNWGPADGVELGKVLPRFLALQTLDLGRNDLGPTGGTAIAEYLKSGVGSLTSVALLGNGFVDATVVMLLELKKQKPTLTTLCGLKADQTEASFREWNLTLQDAKLLAPEIAAHRSLTHLDLAWNKRLGEEGIQAICEALKGNPTLKELQLYECGFEPAAGKHLPGMLRAKRSPSNRFTMNLHWDSKNMASSAEAARIVDLYRSG